MNKGFCVWFTGLSGSGKTTLSKLLEDEMLERGLSVEVLDGDIIRENLSKGLGFSREDRDTNILRIGFVAGLLARNNVAVIVAAISPYAETRKNVRDMMDNFVEVFVNCPLEECIERDTKGLYKKALSGEIKNFTGVSDPYENPENPEIEILTGDETPEDSLARLIRSLELLKLIPASPDEDYTDEEKEAVEKKLSDLGYM